MLCPLSLTKNLYLGPFTAQRYFNYTLKNLHNFSVKMESEKKNKGSSRGALVVLEGLDRSGKSSQSTNLISYLEGIGYPVELWRFPDRNTSVGKMISSYLSNQSHLDDRTIHLLFSANRWEKRLLMEDKLKSGTTLIVDRYSYSGVAFSSAKGLDFDWCKAPEAGLLAPDVVLFLDIPPEKAAERGGYGDERYERLDFQRKVGEKYQALRDNSWKYITNGYDKSRNQSSHTLQNDKTQIVDACLPMEEVHKQLKDHVMECIKCCENGKPLSQLWLH